MPITCTSAQCSLLRLGGRIYYILRCRRCAHADAQALDLFATEEYEICRLKSQRRFVPFTAPYGASEGQGSEAKAEREGLELHVGAFEHVHRTISHVEGYHRILEHQQAVDGPPPLSDTLLLESVLSPI